MSKVEKIDVVFFCGGGGGGSCAVGHKNKIPKRGMTQDVTSRSKMATGVISLTLDQP